MALSNKATNWKNFNDVVIDHIENYSVPQYGPDIKTNVDVEDTVDCLKYIAKYKNRHGSSRRGRIEELRDLVKIAHFAQLGFDMMSPTEAEIALIREGIR